LGSRFHITSGIYEVFLKRSGENLDEGRRTPRAKPYISCYTPRRLKGGERNVARSVAE